MKTDCVSFQDAEIWIQESQRRILFQAKREQIIEVVRLWDILPSFLEQGLQILLSSLLGMKTDRVIIWRVPGSKLSLRSFKVPSAFSTHSSVRGFIEDNAAFDDLF